MFTYETAKTVVVFTAYILILGTGYVLLLVGISHLTTTIYNKVADFFERWREVKNQASK